MRGFAATTLDTALSLATPAVKGDLEDFNGFAFDFTG